jgi:hypothetical protein
VEDNERIPLAVSQATDVSCVDVSIASRVTR